MAAQEARTIRIRRPLLAAVPLLLVLPLIASAPVSSQVPLQPELHIEATVNPHGERLGPEETGFAYIDAEVTCESPGLIMEPIEVLFTFQTWPSYGVDIQPDFVETEVSFEPDQCLGSGHPESVFLEVGYSFSDGFYDPVEIELWAAHQGDDYPVTSWEEPAGIHADWEVSLEQRGTIMVDTLIPMKGQVHNHGNVPIDVEVIVRDPPRRGTLNHPQRLTVPDGGGTETFHLEYSADQLGQERFTVLLQATTTEEPHHELDPHVARVSFDIVERQSTVPVGAGDSSANLPAGTLLLLMLAVGAIALLAWRKHHRDQDERPQEGDGLTVPVDPDPAEPVAMKTNEPTVAPPAGPPVPKAFHVKQARSPED